jgi:hypothetical protein
MAAGLAITSGNLANYMLQLQQMFGFRTPWIDATAGFWHQDGFHPYYRLPVLAAFVMVAGTMTIWPAQRNLGTLISCSGALMLGTQFWHAHGGGIFIAWYLPLLLLAVFRPNLEDRVILARLGERWSQVARTGTRATPKPAAFSRIDRAAYEVGTPSETRIANGIVSPSGN